MGGVAVDITESEKHFLPASTQTLVAIRVQHGSWLRENTGVSKLVEFYSHPPRNANSDRRGYTPLYWRLSAITPVDTLLKQFYNCTLRLTRIVKERGHRAWSLAFYWDLNNQTRAWSDRFFKATNERPTMVQAGVYRDVLQYLKAVETLKNAKDGRTVVAKMKQSQPGTRSSVRVRFAQMVTRITTCISLK